MTREFVYGVATSSFQIEGASSLRDASIWDTFCRGQGNIADSSNGDVACEHYERWQDDLELIESIGVDAYRFSVSWPRVVRADGSVNEEGLQFYLNILDALNCKGIKPFVTLYHWDLPQHLEDNGGWLNRETAYRFAEYADVVSQAFGDRVHSYATLNEPFCSAYLGYEVGVHAPGRTGRANGRRAAHHLLLAHGLAMQVLRKNCPNVLAGIVLNFTPCYPDSSQPQDAEATRLADEYINQWYMKPIMQGAYPDIIEALSPEDRPPVEEGDLATIAQPLDFLGVNFYTRLTYRASRDDLYEELLPSQVPTTAMGWEIYPKALTELLVSLHNTYALPPIYITENGAAMDDELKQDKVEDWDRVDYYHAHLNALHDAAAVGVDIRGYFAWSLMDNFEWAEGYVKRFGLVYVDFKSQTRLLKQSAHAYRNLIEERQ